MFKNLIFLSFSYFSFFQNYLKKYLRSENLQGCTWVDSRSKQFSNATANDVGREFQKIYYSSHHENIYTFVACKLDKSNLPHSISLCLLLSFSYAYEIRPPEKNEPSSLEIQGKRFRRLITIIWFLTINRHSYI